MNNFLAFALGSIITCFLMLVPVWVDSMLRRSQVIKRQKIIAAVTDTFIPLRNLLVQSESHLFLIRQKQIEDLEKLTEQESLVDRMEQKQERIQQDEHYFTTVEEAHAAVQRLKEVVDYEDHSLLWPLD